MELLLCFVAFTACLLVCLFARRLSPRYALTRRTVRKIVGLASVVFFMGLLLTPTRATTITEYVVPGNPGLWDLSVDEAGIVWFTEGAGNNIGGLKLSTGTVEQIPIPTTYSNPWGITVVPSTWAATAAVFTESYGNKIGVVARNATHNIAEYTVPTTGSGLRKIVYDSSRNCTWFTEYAAGKIGRFSFPAAWSAQIVEYSLLAGANPIGIAIDSTLTQPASGQPYIWVADFSRRSIVRIHPETGVFREYSVDPFNPWDVAVDPDGIVWFTAQRTGTDINIIGRLNPVAHETSKWSLTTFRVPTPNSEVHEIEVDSSGSIWFTEFSDYASKIGKYTPLTNVFTEYPIITPTAKPQGLAVYTEAGGTINVWFTEFGGRRIGRIRQPEGPTVSTTVYSITYAVTTSSTVLTASTGTTAGTAHTVVASRSTPILTSASATTASSTIVDTVSIVLTSSTYWTTTRTSTTTTSFTTSTTTYTQTSVSYETTSTTTSVTATRVSTSWESVTVLTSATVVSISLFSETTSTTTTETKTSTSFSPTVTVPTTTTTSSSVTFHSPTVTITSTALIETSTTTTSTTETTTTSYSPTVTITSTTTTVTTFLPIQLRPCLIASAAYGSSLAPEVQSLRSFRNERVLSTFAGSQFMKVFNAFYYSFSPTIASMITTSPALTAAMRAFLYPLIGILQMSSYVSGMLWFASDLAVLVSGVLASALFGVVYILSPAMGIRFLIRRMSIVRRVMADPRSRRLAGHR